MFIDVGYKNGKPYVVLLVDVNDKEKAGINLLHHYIKYLDDWLFNAMFTTARLPVELARFERAYLNFAVAEYLKNRSSQNFIYSETIYNNEVQYAKETKPIRYNQGNVEYNISPYS